MNQYLTGFITAIFLTTSFFLFIGAKKRAIDNLTVQNITIISTSGKIVGKIGSDKLNSYLWLKSPKSKNPDIEFLSKGNGSTLKIRNSSGKAIVSISADNKSGGNMTLSGRNGITSLKLESDFREGGSMTCFNLRGSETVYLGTNKINGGQIKTYNGLGLETVFLGTDQNDAGLLSLNNNLGQYRAMIGVGSSGKGLLDTVAK